MKKSLLAALLCTAAFASPLLADAPVVRVESFGNVPLDPSTLLFSRNHDHFAAVVPSGPRAAVLVDGKLTRKYDEIIAAGPAHKPYMIFNATGEHFAFLARRGPSTVFVIDGQEQPLPDSATVSAAHFSPDGSQFVIALSTPGQPTQIFLNGKSLGQFQNVSIPRFSANSRHLGFIANTPTGPAAIIDGRPGPIFQNVANLEFSPDGDHFAYIATGAFSGDNLQHLVVDGWKLAAFDHISSVKFSPAGDHISFVGESLGAAYANAPAAQTIVGFDDLRWPATPDAGKHFAPQLSPDGDRIAYIESSPRDPRLLTLTINGAHGKESPDISNFHFSPDGAHFTYAAADPRGLSVFLDETPSDPVTSLLTPPVFSADSRHLMFIGTKSVQPAPRPGDRYDFNNRQRPVDAAPVLVIDNRTYPIPRLRDEAAPAQLQFSPDANHVAYTLGNNIVVDGDIFRLPDPRATVADLRFSPDSQHLLFTSPDPNSPGRNLLVIDGQIIPGFSLLTAPNFLPDNTLTAFATDQRTNSLARLTIALPQPNNFGLRPNYANQNDNPQQPDPNNPPRSRTDKKIDKAVDTANKLRGLFDH